MSAQNKSTQQKPAHSNGVKVTKLTADELKAFAALIKKSDKVVESQYNAKGQRHGWTRKDPKDVKPTANRAYRGLKGGSYVGEVSFRRSGRKAATASK